MPDRRQPLPRIRPSLAWILLAVLLATLWVAGGASRADAAGQVIVRGISAAILVIAVLFGRRARFQPAKPVMFLLAAAIALAVLQLVPLPPTIWQALPGRAAVKGVAMVIGEGQPWRSWSITPGATANALASLIVPVTALLLMAGMTADDRMMSPGLLLCVVVAAMLLGLLQFSGAGFDNPLINETPGSVSGSFANRNHFALFLALGCLLVPGWVFLDGRRAGWRGPVGLALVLLFFLTILASGSRAGTALGLIALAIGIGLSWGGIRSELRRYPRWVFPALVACMIVTVVIVVLISVAADRAVSIDRVFAVDPEQDMRSRGLSTVIAMIREYFPAGSGLGGFDPIFRMHEPFDLLKPTFFNHAHDDLIEVVLDAGLPGLLLLLSGLAWWAWASIAVWRKGRSSRHTLPKLGSAILLLVILASAFDYPVRTPMIMAIVVIAGTWLAEERGRRRESALPRTDQHL